jgi:hypothetical protein
MGAAVYPIFLGNVAMIRMDKPVDCCELTVFLELDQARGILGKPIPRSG